MEIKTRFLRIKTKCRQAFPKAVCQTVSAASGFCNSWHRPAILYVVRFEMSKPRPSLFTTGDRRKRYPHGHRPRLRRRRRHRRRRSVRRGIHSFGPVVAGFGGGGGGELKRSEFLRRRRTSRCVESTGSALSVMTSIELALKMYTG